MQKKRLDVLMVEKGLVQSRERAKALVMSAQVLVNGSVAQKAGEMYLEEDEIVLKEADCPYVSRGGFKLEKAIQEFGLQLRGRVCMDVGASTGGFTDCMLLAGAEKVYAVDVGYGQLAWKLRQDPRVIVMERVNARYLKSEDFEPAPSFASMDVSFISLKLIVPALRELEVQEIAALIKPQFEAGKEKVGKKGIVREAATHEEVLKRVTEELRQIGYATAGLTYSPIRGQNGNIEFLGHFCLNKSLDVVSDEMIHNIVAQAHADTHK
ncbi:MAG: TlyA family rRNA (cytidine-2'-O)-methyltransferase [Clostridiales bacterium]|nr:MAG: TlyA family rRNA (cytidine-2'-O)-methyltransferase [Clostridiales bacterium]